MCNENPRSIGSPGRRLWVNPLQRRHIRVQQIKCTHGPSCTRPTQPDSAAKRAAAINRKRATYSRRMARGRKSYILISGSGGPGCIIVLCMLLLLLLLYYYGKTKRLLF